MSLFVHLLEELAEGEATLTAGEVRRLRNRIGDKTLQMGHLQEDGSMSIPIDCVIEAVQSMGSRSLNEAVASLKNPEAEAMFESAEKLVDCVSEARRRRLAQLVDDYQAEPDDTRARAQWKEIEKMTFGVDYRD